MKKRTAFLFGKFAYFLAFALLLSGCGIQSIPKARNQVEATLAEVTNQYKRRADLIPNLVQVVKGYAAHEQETLTAVIEARSKATATRIDPSNLSAEDLQRFMDAQSGLTQALSRLMIVVERYPNLKANENFRDLQAQLEGTENRITVARQRHIDAIRQFNDLITVPPTSFVNMIFYRHEKLPQWTVEAEEREQIERAPSVEF